MFHQYFDKLTNLKYHVLICNLLSVMMSWYFFKSFRDFSFIFVQLQIVLLIFVQLQIVLLIKLSLFLSFYSLDTNGFFLLF